MKHPLHLAIPAAIVLLAVILLCRRWQSNKYMAVNQKLMKQLEKFDSTNDKPRSFLLQNGVWIKGEIVSPTNERGAIFLKTDGIFIALNNIGNSFLANLGKQVVLSGDLHYHSAYVFPSSPNADGFYPAERGIPGKRVSGKLRFNNCTIIAP